MPDIDIDFADRNIVLDKLKHRVAKLDTGKKHNTGVYFTEVPHNPLDKVSTLDYKQAEDRGYFKVDFLNVSIYGFWVGPIFKHKCSVHSKFVILS